MAEPRIAHKGSIALELEPGTYFWCQCGESKNQPFCDGSHQESEFQPLQFTIEEKKKLYLCQCKRSLNKPYCDGTHRDL